MDQVDCVVVGAGAVGLAIARALAMAGREVLILEAADAIGTGTSSRNSEVIHAGIYYPRGSLKAELCVAGRKTLYDYCQSHGVPYRRLGKLIVATDDAQLGKLEEIAGKARVNGVDDLEIIDGARARSLEPALSATGALLSPSTGIIDSHQLMLAYLGDAESAGAMLALESPLLSARPLDGSGFTLSVGGAQPMEIGCRWLINSAGLFAPQLAARIEGLAPDFVPQAHFCKGNYFTLAGRSPFSRLIYPVPEAAGLGVHLTLDLGGQAKFGPDVEWVETDGAAPLDYQVNPTRGESFYAAIRRYWPALPDGALMPAYSGYRPKLGGPAEAAADFVIEGPETHGLEGLINLFGIESPGLTASLAIGERVQALFA
ncbi:NAD(P)/FAD-dependent oxidoreductase [Radicibacter daui]|uniref:NAD(P)/FAD-dependent oxidoreductase n=1 Tax=Radicibacter daui TaxID=3064829 RepID=UPI004046DED5